MSWSSDYVVGTQQVATIDPRTTEDTTIPSCLVLRGHLREMNAVTTEFFGLQLNCPRIQYSWPVL